MKKNNNIDWRRSVKKSGKERRAGWKSRKLLFSLLLPHDMSFVKVAHSLPQRLKKIASFKTFNVSKEPDLDVELSESLAPSIIQVYSYLCLHIEVKGEAQVLWISDRRWRRVLLLGCLYRPKLSSHKLT